VNEINVAHPFIDGNGRTQRSWLRMLTDNAGFELRLTDRDIKRWNDASARGFTAYGGATKGAPEAKGCVHGTTFLEGVS
jgi:fido (protein-threonine AMPylation protein)